MTSLGEEARSHAHPGVICHADIHAWNVLVAPSGDFAIVDWNETVLAPRERDLMFVDGGPGGKDQDADSFFSGYGVVEVDPVVLAYYRYEWVVQELADFGRRARSRDLGDATRSEALGFLRIIFEPGQVVEGALRAGAALGM